MTTATETASTETIIESAKALRPLIEEHRDEMETQGRMPRVLVDALLDSDLFRLLLPRSAGGSETDPVTFMRVAEEISRVDGSAGWNFMIGSGSAFAAGFLSVNAVLIDAGLGPVAEVAVVAVGVDVALGWRRRRGLRCGAAGNQAEQREHAQGHSTVQEPARPGAADPCVRPLKSSCHYL